MTTFCIDFYNESYLCTLQWDATTLFSVYPSGYSHFNGIHCLLHAFIAKNRDMEIFSWCTLKMIALRHHEANIRDGENHLRRLYKSVQKPPVEGGGGGGRSDDASPPHHHPISIWSLDIPFKDDVTAVLLLRVSFISQMFSILNLCVRMLYLPSKLFAQMLQIRLALSGDVYAGWQSVIYLADKHALLSNPPPPPVAGTVIPSQKSL